MSKADRPTKLYFKGQYDATGQPLEFFGGTPSEYDPIPARDLGPDDTAALTEAQWRVLESDTGKRLYQKSEPTNRTDDTAAEKLDEAIASDTTPPA
jgi:hypothetical protein